MPVFKSEDGSSSSPSPRRALKRARSLPIPRISDLVFGAKKMASDDTESLYLDAKDTYDDLEAPPANAGNFVARGVSSLRNVSFNPQIGVKLPNLRSLRGKIAHHKSAADELDAIRNRLTENESVFVIKPSTVFSNAENGLVLMCMLWILVVIPFEVGVWIDPYNQGWDSDEDVDLSNSKALLGINVFVEIILIFDVFVHFFKAYEERLVLGTVQLITDKHAIFEHYVRGHLLTDTISAVPITIILHSTNASYVANPWLGLLLLLKLFRMRKFKAMLYDLAWFKGMMQRTAFTTVTLTRYAFTLLILIHYIACAYAFCAKVTRLPDSCMDCATPNDCCDEIAGPWENSWVGKFFKNQDVSHNMFFTSALSPESNFKFWLLSVYWAAMTITSIGYGDVTPYSESEFVVVTVAMLVMGFSWTYMIGAVAGMVATASKKRLKFEENLQDVNDIIRDSKIKPELADALRTYVYSYHYNRVSLRNKYEEVITDVLSPGLRGDVAMEDQGWCINKVWYLRDVHHEIAAQLAQKFRPSNFARYDIITTCGVLATLRMGLGAMMDRTLHVLSTGSVWGLDFVLHNSALVETYRVRCLTFLELLSMSKNDLNEILENNSTAHHRAFAKSLKFAAAKISLKRWLILRALETSERYRSLDVGISTARALASTSAFAESKLNGSFVGMNDPVRLKTTNQEEDRVAAPFSEVDNPSWHAPKTQSARLEEQLEKLNANVLKLIENKK